MGAEHLLEREPELLELGLTRLLGGDGAHAASSAASVAAWERCSDWNRRLWRSACSRISAGITATTESPNAHQYADAKAAEVAAGPVGAGERRAEHDREDGGADRAARRAARR